MHSPVENFNVLGCTIKGSMRHTFVAYEYIGIQIIKYVIIRVKEADSFLEIFRIMANIFVIHRKRGCQ